MTLIGYSQGSAQIYYGLAKKQDYFAPRVHRFIALASCISPSRPASTYVNTIQEFLWYDQSGLYNVNGGDESSIETESGYGQSLASGLYFT